MVKVESENGETTGGIGSVIILLPTASAPIVELLPQCLGVAGSKASRMGVLAGGIVPSAAGLEALYENMMHQREGNTTHRGRGTRHHNTFSWYRWQ